MALEMIWKNRQTGQWLLAAAIFVMGGMGCANSPFENRNTRIQNEKMDWMDKTSGEDLSKNGTSTARSQSPAVGSNGQCPPSLNPDITPVSSAASPPSSALLLKGEAQVRIVATIGTTPIYEREVREAVYQRLPELINLPPHERRVKEKSFFKEELRRIIERELILDELFAMLKEKKQAGALNQLKEGATKEADSRLSDIQKRAKLTSDEDMKLFMRSQGLTVSGIRRHFERSFMMSAYLAERLKPKINSISFVDIKDYFEEHAEEFMTTDSVKWQDLFIRVDRFRSREDAKKYAEWLLNRAVKGEDFIKLVNEFDQGDSKSREGMGFGEEKGKILPPDLEPTIFSLKQGQITMVEFESGYHLVRIAERTYAGKRKFDDQVQNDIRKKLTGVIGDREYKKIVETLWRKSQPQILTDVMMEDSN